MTDSNIVLESGKNYRFEAIGTWRDASQSNHYIDAEYTTFDGWTDYKDGTYNWGPDQKDLQVNNLFIDWGSYSDVHTYYLDYPGIGSIVNFRVLDGIPATNTPDPGWYGDNSGSLTVNIYRPALDCPWKRKDPFKRVVTTRTDLFNWNVKIEF